MVYLSTILISILVPLCVSLISVFLAISISKENSKMTDTHYCVYVPKLVMIIGCVVMLTGTLLCICFTIFSEETPHWIFYLICTLIFTLGFYLFFKTIKWKVVVANDMIRVSPLFSKVYSLSFSDIESVKCQVKKNRLKSERLIIKCKTDKKFIVESTEVSYKRFKKQIENNVNSKYLEGFDK